MKTCCKCKQTLSAEHFSTDRSRKDGLFKYCKPCHSEVYETNKAAKLAYQKAYRLKNLERHKAWSLKSRLRLKYNITPEQVDAMLAKQENKCLICTQPFEGNRTPCIDHCHDSGNVRGLLCRACNSVLGLLQENPDNFTRAKAYLERHAHMKS